MPGPEIPQDLAYSFVGKLAARLGKPIVVFDFEATTFLGRSTFGICEVALATISANAKGKVTAAFVSELINPENPISGEAQRLHGITPAMVRNKEPWGHRFATLFDRVAREAVACGFNIKTFDCPAALQENKRYGVPTDRFGTVLDVKTLFNRLHNNRKGRLTEVAQAYSVAPRGDAHRALADVLMTLEVLDRMVQQHGEEVVAHEGKTAPAPAGVSSLTTRVAEAILRDGYTGVKALSQALRVAPAEAGYALSRALDAKLVRPDQVALQPTREWLAEALALNVDSELLTGNIRLKPLYEQLLKDVPADLEFDYVQLKVALLDAGLLN